VVFSFSNKHFNLYDQEGAKSLTQWLLNQEAHHAKLERLDPDAAVRDNKRVQVGLADLQAWPLFWESLPVGHFFVDSTFAFLDVRATVEKRALPACALEHFDKTEAADLLPDEEGGRRCARRL
jgi:hypothetical protein